MNLLKVSFGAVAAAALVSISACDNGPSAVATRVRPDTSAAGYERTTPSADRYDREDRGASEYASDRGERRGPRGPIPDDSSRWASSRKYSGAENAEYQFKKNGEAFGARSIDDFVDKASNFVTKPPRGVERIERANGDTLLYDPKSNTFAVATRTGEPRTMFKPREGMAYWEEQKARANSRGSRGDRDRG